jgi:hypothetical protein
MHVIARAHNEHGQVMVLAAVLIPVALVLTGLVVETGNWFTRDRQLQNRADAAALAAGVAYGQNWQNCAQDSDPTLKAQAAQAIANTARQYAGDPDASDYNLPQTIPPGAPSAALHNDQLTFQNKIDVVVNSRNNIYSDDMDFTDDYDGTGTPPAYDDTTRNGTPCIVHTSDPEGLSAPGHWTDVKVTERKAPGFFLWDGLSPDLHARARVEIRPAISGHRFMPIAVPDNVVTRVQVRYYDGCTGAQLLKQDLAKLPDSDYAGYKNGGGGSLWALPSLSTPAGATPVGDKTRSVGLALAAYDPGDCGPAGLQYRPITEEVRLASNPTVDLDRPCNELKDLNFADCFTRLSQIRIWKDGNPDADEVLIKDVRVSGGCAGPGDAYFSVLPLADPDCKFDVSVDVDWGKRDDAELDVPANFTVKANGVTLASAGGSGNTKTYASSGGALAFPVGPKDITIELHWLDTNPVHTWETTKCIDPPGSTPSPCKYDLAPQRVHHIVVGLNSTQTQTPPKGDPNATGSVESVHTSLQAVDSSGNLGPSFDNWVPSSSGGNPCTAPCAIYPTVGIRGALSTGTLTVLRTDASNGSQLVHCDPDVTGQVLRLFKNGCQPWFAPNSFTDPDWWTSAQRCPDKTKWYSYAATSPYNNGPRNPWRCVINDSGKSVGQAGDWMAVATKNCNQINGGVTQCNDFAKAPPAGNANCASFDGIDKNGNGTIESDEYGWRQKGGDSRDPRVIQLFVVPYQALKDVQGTSTEAAIPVLRFASFYVMNWRGNGGSSDDPCPDPDFGVGPVKSVPLPGHPKGNGMILGVFVSTVEYETGPVDEEAVCQIDDPTPCRAILVR